MNLKNMMSTYHLISFMWNSRRVFLFFNENWLHLQNERSDWPERGHEQTSWVIETFRIFSYLVFTCVSICQISSKSTLIIHAFHHFTDVNLTHTRNHSKYWILLNDMYAEVFGVKYADSLHLTLKYSKNKIYWRIAIWTSFEEKDIAKCWQL